MAKTIPQLTDATTVNAADELIIHQGGVTKRATGAELFNSGITVTSTSTTTGRSLNNRFAEMFNVKDYGATGDGTTNDTQAFIDTFSAVVAAGGGTVYIPSGLYSIRQKITVACNAQQHIRVLGTGRYQSTLKFGGGSDLGLSFVSSSSSDNQLPSFQIEHLGFTATRDNIGTALSVSYSNPNNIDATVYAADLFIGQDVDNISETGSGYGYWNRGIYCNNCRNGEIRNVHFYGEMNRPSSQTSAGIYLEGESTAFVISSVLVLEATTGIYCTGTSEGLYVHNSDLVGVLYGVYHDITSGAEPQLTVTDSHINSQNVGVWTRNVQQSVVANCLIYANSWLSTSSWPTWTGVKFEGIDGRYNKVVGCTFAKEGQRTGDTTQGIDFNAGSHYSATGNHFFGFSGNTMTYGIIVRSGVSDCIIGDDNVFHHVADNVSITPTSTKISHQPLIRAGAGVYASGATVTFGQAFPHAANTIVATHRGTATNISTAAASLTTAGFTVYHNGAGSIAIDWIAAGE